VLYALASGAILPYTLWYVNNPDAFQYISIARKIADGHFAHSINGYWSPLLSWFLAVPLFFGINSIIAFKLVQIIIGFFLINAWLRLLALLDFGNLYKGILALAIIPFALDYALLNATADLLFLTVLFYCLIIFLKNEWMNSRSEIIRLGVLGSLLYFSKAFGFPLFISLLGLTAILSISKKEHKQIIHKIFPALVVFLSLSSLWILHLSIKYHHVTISEAAKFNLSKEVAPKPEQIMQLPVLNGPLLYPPDEFSLSAWESPGEIVGLTQINPLRDWSDYKQIIKRNVLSIWYHDFRNQLGFIFIFILLIFLFFRKRFEIKNPRPILFLFFVMMIVYGGYSLILVHPRYVWICTLIMLLLSAWIWEKIHTKKEWMQDLLCAVFILVVLIAVKRPVKEILFTKDEDVPMLWIGKGLTHPFETMKITYRPEKELCKAIEALKRIPQFKGRMASLNSLQGERHAYSSSLFIANEFNTPYYGPLDTSLSVEEMKGQLQASGISVFLVWDHGNWKAKDEAWCKELFFDQNLGLTVFGLF